MNNANLRLMAFYSIIIIIIIIIIITFYTWKILWYCTTYLCIELCKKHFQA